MTMPVIAASIEGLLVFLVIVLLSALSNWLKQKKELEQQQQRGLGRPPSVSGPPPISSRQPVPGTPIPPASQTPAPARPAFDLEEQLRRLLEGEVEVPEPEVAPKSKPQGPEAPKKTAVPPPLIPQTKPPTPQTSPSQPVPATVTPVQQRRVPPTPTSSSVHRQAKAEGPPTTTLASAELAKLEASAAAYKRAAELAAQTAARLQEIASLKGAGRYPRTHAFDRGMSPEVLQVRGMLENPRSASQAIIAAVVLGPPRSLKETPEALWAIP